MSRLDDLKKKRDRLKKEFNAGIDRHSAYIERNFPDSDVNPYTVTPEAGRMADENTRLHYEIEAVEKEITEEEKRIAAQKAHSFRPQRYPEKERFCSRCGSPLGYQTLCYRCLTLNG